ncbi:MAG: YbaN family protein [Lachnospiraceae bacterium]|nr:YbaN family protein [Lachnospiraceae bacterium]
MKIKKLLWLTIGGISLVLGSVTALIPMLPTFPFLLLATISFAKSSEKISNWFVNTKLYRENLESYLKGLGMTIKAKIRLIITVTLGMGTGFFFMYRKELYIPCVILTMIWIGHIIYFIFGVKTREEEGKERVGLGSI